MCHGTRLDARPERPTPPIHDTGPLPRRKLLTRFRAISVACTCSGTPSCTLPRAGSPRFGAHAVAGAVLRAPQAQRCPAGHRPFVRSSLARHPERSSASDASRPRIHLPWSDRAPWRLRTSDTSAACRTRGRLPSPGPPAPSGRQAVREKLHLRGVGALLDFEHSKGTPATKGTFEP